LFGQSDARCPDWPQLKQAPLKLLLLQMLKTKIIMHQLESELIIVALRKDVQVISAHNPGKGENVL
jgi:hypothetical protein